MPPSPRRVRLELAYDGTEFAGWQVQPGLRTVQGTVEQALGLLQGDRPARLRGAGRTDSGVHAAGQVADAEIVSRLDDRDLFYSLRRILPRDVRPTSVATVDPRFHSRVLARGKTYRYTVDLCRHGDPIRARYALHVPWKLDVALVGRALALLPGRRDWTGFAASACEVVDRVRSLSEARLEQPRPDLLELVFTADGFLHHMVRNLVGTVLEIGRGRMELERIATVLESGTRHLAGPTAAARGLCLERVHYDRPAEGATGHAPAGSAV